MSAYINVVKIEFWFSVTAELELSNKFKKGKKKTKQLNV